MIERLRMACGKGDGQNIAEYALLLALILVAVGGGIWFIAHQFTGQ
jgi:uncharacterized protein (UPF0333 family)